MTDFDGLPVLIAVPKASSGRVKANAEHRRRREAQKAAREQTSACCALT